MLAIPNQDIGNHNAPNIILNFPWVMWNRSFKLERFSSNKSFTWNGSAQMQILREIKSLVESFV
jgi:hypothetical protein